MASYAELFDLRTNSALRNKIAVAVTIKAQGLIAGETPTAAEVAWSVAALKSPLDTADSLFNYVLAANKALTVAQIQAASDAAIQTAVDAAVTVIVSGGA